MIFVVFGNKYLYMNKPNKNTVSRTPNIFALANYGLKLNKYAEEKNRPASFVHLHGAKFTSDSQFFVTLLSKYLHK